MNIRSFKALCLKLNACSAAMRWLDRFDDEAHVFDAFNELRLFDAFWFHWFIYRLDSHTYEYRLRRMRSEYNELVSKITTSRIEMNADLDAIMAGSPVNLDRWEARVRRWEAENDQYWREFKKEVAFDLAQWLDFLERYY